MLLLSLKSSLCVLVGGAVNKKVVLMFGLRSWLFVFAGGGLDKIVVLMEGESLFNDATSIVLFEIFFDMVKKLGSGGPGTEGGLFQEGLNIVVQISWLAAGICSSSSLGSPVGAAT